MCNLTVVIKADIVEQITKPQLHCNQNGWYRNFIWNRAISHLFILIPPTSILKPWRILNSLCLFFRCKMFSKLHSICIGAITFLWKLKYGNILHIFPNSGSRVLMLTILRSEVDHLTVLLWQLRLEDGNIQVFFPQIQILTLAPAAQC